MVWKKGQSGNPGGRKSERGFLAPALRAVLRNRPEEDGPTNREIIAEKLVELAAAGDVQAIKVILERIDGKVPDSVALTGAGGGPLRVVLLWPEGERDD